jgi:hypothetical protein
LLLHLRSEISERHDEEDGRKTKGRSRGERFMFRIWLNVMTRPWLYNASAGLGRLSQRFIMHDGKIGRVRQWVARLAPLLGAWTIGRDLRPLEEKSFRERWRSELAGKR